MPPSVVIVFVSPDIVRVEDKVQPPSEYMLLDVADELHIGIPCGLLLREVHDVRLVATSSKPRRS